MYKHWYAVQVRGGKEEAIVQTCKHMVDTHYLIDCFIPKCRRMKRCNGNWQLVEEVLFRGYIFMISHSVDDLFVELKKIPDLTKILGNDGSNIYPILEEEIDFLLKFGTKEHIVEMSSGFIVGDTIQITKGPLIGQEGSITKINRHKRIAYVNISLFGQITTVKVGLEVISKD